MLEVVDLLRKIMGKMDIEPVILDQAAAEIRDQYLDCSKAKRMLNWSPRFRMEDGLEETVRWYSDYLAKQ